MAIRYNGGLPSAQSGLPTCRWLMNDYKSFVQNSCRLSFMHCITTGKGIGSFLRIFFRKDFHRMFLVGSDENFSVNFVIVSSPGIWWEWYAISVCRHTRSARRCCGCPSSNSCLSPRRTRQDLSYCGIWRHRTQCVPSRWFARHIPTVPSSWYRIRDSPFPIV